MTPTAEPAGSLYDLIGVYDRPPTNKVLQRIRLLCFIAAGVNFVSTVPALVNSVLYDLFGVEAPVHEWVHNDAPTRPWLAWIFFCYGALWGVFFLFIAAKAVERRAWMKAAIAEKLLTTVVVWADFVIFNRIGWRLPVIVLVTDLAFVFVFTWTLRAARRLAVDAHADGADASMARLIPVGSSPPARWLLRLVSWPTIVLASVVAVASIVEMASPESACLDPTTPAAPGCDTLGTTNLWSLPPFLVLLWVGMAAILAAAMLWASSDVVRRRDIIGFGVASHLIPVGALLLGLLADDEQRRPTTAFLWVVVGELCAAALLWLAKRTANASALWRGVEDDIPSAGVVAEAR